MLGKSAVVFPVLSSALRKGRPPPNLTLLVTTKKGLTEVCGEQPGKRGLRAALECWCLAPQEFNKRKTLPKKPSSVPLGQKFKELSFSVTKSFSKEQPPVRSMATSSASDGQEATERPVLGRQWEGAPQVLAPPPARWQCQRPSHPMPMGTPLPRDPSAPMDAPCHWSPHPSGAPMPMHGASVAWGVGGGGRKGQI